THPDDVEATRERVKKLRAGEIDNYALEKRYVRKDGSAVWSSTTVTLLRKESGEAAQYIGIIQDITERKQTENVLARLAAVVEHTDDAIVTKTLDGIITTWNPGAERIFGYTADEAIGKPVTILIPEKQLNEEPGILERLRRGERIDHYQTTRRRKDGTLIDVSLTVSPIKDRSGRVVGASKIARDITHQKRAEATLREMDQRKDEFLATLAHELRNPLAPIRQATLISMSPSASEAQKRWSHEVITRQVHHMSLLLDDLLDISRITRGTLELRTVMTNLTAVVDAAVETSRPALEAKHHEFLVELPPAPVQFAADPLRLAQVLSNLLTNAAKYTDPRGTIRLRATADAKYVEFSVTDTGVGLPQDALSAVFSMFSQVKSSQDRSEGGLGIGLALSRGVVELHGGTIEARSAGLGKGSEFFVRIPRRKVSSHTQSTAGGAAVATPGKRRVLIADDNRDAAESLAMLLEIEGHSVTVVHDGQQALAAIEAARPDVALLDIGMPEMDGYEVARQVRGDSRSRSTLLIALTGWGQEQDKARAMGAGFDMHFTKPVEPQRLIELLGAELPAR
ncbi:MAG TPA: PAS domain S-box protein, partial [Steroidobacteraceae bacterium]|nr:PAS domain S-box protein [Steroidobacteraceae bacterium]